MLGRVLAPGLRLLAVVVPAMLGGAVVSDLDALPGPASRFRDAQCEQKTKSFGDVPNDFVRSGQ